jgi:hypothetical protein
LTCKKRKIEREEEKKKEELGVFSHFWRLETNKYKKIR